MTLCAQCGAEHDPGTSPCRDSTLVGRTLGAGIRVREHLGDTPFGKLYRAVYPSGAEVAVLLLGSRASDPAELALLRERFRQAIQIQHPNVAAIHDLSETADGLVYVVAEYLGGEGELLSETLARRGRLSQDEALDLCFQTAAGLTAAHAARWVHGDLSPETILLSRTGRGTLVKLIGFTQASVLANPVSTPLVAADGVVEYASPERLACQKIDERSDVYSLGAVLYHLLSGVPPTRPAEGVRLPEPIRSVLSRALTPSPLRRYQTVAEFVAAITPPAEQVVRLRSGATKRARRKVVSVGAAAAVLITLSAGLWLWSTQRLTFSGLRRPRVQESGAVTQPPRGSVLGSSSTSSAPTRPPTKPSSASPVRRNAVSFPTAPAASGPRPADGAVSRDSARESKISPFRRSHPWVAVAGERFYYRSSCPEAFSLRDLIYFRTEEEARASGFVPGRVHGCLASGTAADKLLVDVRSVDSTIQVDLRYATANNFTGAPLPGYEAPRALLRPEVAAAVGRVQARLRSKGLGLRIFDAYRPVRATLAMVEWAERTGRRELLESGYIAKRSRHNQGVAVDLTLVDLATGTELPMGTAFEELTPAAHLANATGEALRSRHLLVRAMESEGFGTYEQAWWHFNYSLEGAMPLDVVIR
ncbi:MAG TPA: M15 family metallopeptidase [Gemmatimonadales bacterium]|nr:M15 family metallopeptidase [Gemmatimonadales bacterium]